MCPTLSHAFRRLKRLRGLSDSPSQQSLADILQQRGRESRTPMTDRAMPRGLQAHAAERSLRPAPAPANIRASGDLVRAQSRLWLNAIADAMLGTVVVILGMTGIHPVMRRAASLSAATFPEHDPVVAIPILLAVASSVLATGSVVVKSWANGVPMRTYFTDPKPPGNP